MISDNEKACRAWPIITPQTKMFVTFGPNISEFFDLSLDLGFVASDDIKSNKIASKQSLLTFSWFQWFKQRFQNRCNVNKISKSVLTVSCWWSAASRSGHSGGQTKKIFWGHIFKHHSLNGRWVQKSSNQLIYLSWMKYIMHTYFNA